MPWICDLPFLSSEAAIEALNCCISFCSSAKLWVSHLDSISGCRCHIFLSQTRIMATGAVAILCFRYQLLDASEFRQHYPRVVAITDFYHRHQMVLPPDSIADAVKPINSMQVTCAHFFAPVPPFLILSPPGSKTPCSKFARKLWLLLEVL